MSNLSDSEQCFSIVLTFVDIQRNGFTCIGGAGWETQREQMEAWSSIPALTDGDESDFMAELNDIRGDIIGEKSVSAETCERLMGRPIAMLIAEGRMNSCYTVADVLKKFPDLREQFPALTASA